MKAFQSSGDELLFFSGAPQALEVYAALKEKLLAAHPDTRVKVQKSQISFANRYNYAFVSLPRRKTEAFPEGCTVVSFGLGCQVASPRIACAVEPYPGRWTHHVAVQTPAELDGELLGWLDAAYAFSAAK